MAGSPNVAALQAALKAKGLYAAEVDGVRGPITRAATMRFQRRKHLTVDGVAGPQTRRALGRRGRPGLGRRPLSQPNVGWDVAGLQFLLWRRGFSPGAIDGAFGPGTARAVFAYQRSAGLAADGVAGPLTIGALRRGAVRHPDSPVRFYRPVGGPIGDGFGHVGGRRHTGIDFPASRGTPIKAGGRGVVEFAGWNSGGYGNLVVVRHRLGFSSWYAHMSRIVAGPGQAVSGGTVIGYVGSTGRSTGPHLHFEVRRFDTPVDPIPYLLAGTAARASAAPDDEHGHEHECGAVTGGRADAVPARGPARFARAHLPGC
ncbi:MAG TPA: peptidoglycan DD-metalloendopeptidase family protein [Thermoleophilaceae bacterium]|nr:peptidoglycan DD-metalloendopeptidase family protein [Thermoleophilaceae bacterium]